MFKLKIIILIILSIHSLFAQKRQIAITIDDPKTEIAGVEKWENVDSSLLATLRKHEVQSALFVCGMRVNSSDGKQLLQNWDNENHLIANHSYSHLYYHGASVSVGQFVEDFNKGHALIESYKNYTPLFRFPYLKEGNTEHKRDTMRAVLKANNYRHGYVTIDASDWYVDAEISKALRSNAKVDLRPYKEFYIHHILDRANYYDSLASSLSLQNVKHTLLIHYSLLNALFLDDLLTELKKNNWDIIDAQEAYGDPSFIKLPEILPCGESIIWQYAKQSVTNAKNLRYPGEDARYEKEPLEHFLKSWTKD